MMDSPTRKSLDNRLRRVDAAVVEFRQAVDSQCPHELLRIALRDKQEQLWKRLEPRLARIKADAAQGCNTSLHWIGARLDELGYVLARGELLQSASADTVRQNAREAASHATRIAEAQRERDAWVAKATHRPSVAVPARSAPPRVTIVDTEVMAKSYERQRAPSTPPSCDHGVASEAWVRELEGVRRGGMPATVGASRTEDVIPRK